MILRLALAVLLGWALGFAAFVIALPRPADGVITDGIVVVTGSSGRIEHGLELLEARRAKRMLISGVDRRVKPHELAREFNARPGLVGCCVDLGRESVDTRTNASEVAGWVRSRGYRSIRLVTTDWHMPRARFELSRALGPEVAVVPDPVRSEPGLWVLLTEYNKYLLRRVAAIVGI